MDVAVSVFVSCLEIGYFVCVSVTSCALLSLQRCVAKKLGQRCNCLLVFVSTALKDSSTRG